MSADRAMLIVGAGEAGTAAALALRQKGWAGPIQLVSNEAVLPYERPPLSKGTLIEAEDFAPKLIATEAQFTDAGIVFLAGRTVSAIDRAMHSARLSDGEVIGYERLLLATGASPRTLSWPVCAHIKTLRTHTDAMDIREKVRLGRSIIIVGGGFIGLEVAASAVELGARVTVIEAGPRLLMRAVPEAIARAIHAQQEAKGVKIKTGVTPVSVETRGDGAQLVLADGRIVEADLIVVGVGAMPNTELAEEAGLPIDNGVAVDETLVTADADIFAAGDCCSFPHALYDGRRVRLETWRNAQRQGACVAANMLGAAETYCDVPWFWSDQYDQTLQIAGICDSRDTVIEQDFCGEAAASIHLDCEGRLTAACAFGKRGTVAKEIRFAEKAIAKQVKPDVASLSQPDFTFRSLR